MLTADTVRHVLRWETFHVHKDSPAAASSPTTAAAKSQLCDAPATCPGDTLERKKKGVFMHFLIN